MNRKQMPPIPSTMQALRLRAPGGVEGLSYETIDTPAPAAGEALIRVHAAAITRDELDWPTDRLPAIPSYEFSGEIVAVGSGVNADMIGRDVYVLSDFAKDGACAQYAVAAVESIAAKPASTDFVEAAALPLAALSAWQGLFDHGRLERGQRVSIHGAAGGVGHLAVQLAHARGAYVIGTVSTAHAEAARDLGVDQVIDHTRVRFEDEVEPVDLVFDTAGGDRLARSPSVIKPGGRLVSVAAEPPVEMARDRGIQALYFVVSGNGKQLGEIAKLVDGGVLHPRVDTIFPLSQGRQAFVRSMGNHGAGKVVLRVLDQDQE